MGTLQNKREFTSPDRRRIASYEPHTMDLGNGTPVPAYRVVRSVRARRGFGTIIHTLTTFVRNKKQAHKTAYRWSKLTTEDRTGERLAKQTDGRQS